jgi:hypothetical protein
MVSLGMPLSPIVQHTHTQVTRTYPTTGGLLSSPSPSLLPTLYLFTHTHPYTHHARPHPGQALLQLEAHSGPLDFSGHVSRAGSWQEEQDFPPHSSHNPTQHDRYYFIKKRGTQPPVLFRSLNRRLQGYAPWQIIMGTWLVLHLLGNKFLLFGLNGTFPMLDYRPRPYSFPLHPQ